MTGFVMSDWLPPQQGVVPRLRVGQRWISILWALPIMAVQRLLARYRRSAGSLRTLPGVPAQGVHHEIPRHRPVHRTLGVTRAFRVWLRLQHFPEHALHDVHHSRQGSRSSPIIRGCIGRRDCTPGTEWFRFQHAVPKDRVWTSKDDSVTIPKWLGIPGVRHSIGLARWWHFSIVLLWTINGVAFYLLIFATGQWLRLVPVTHLGVFSPARSRPRFQYLARCRFLRVHQLDELQQLATTRVFHHGVRCRPARGRHRLDAEPGDRQSARLGREDLQSPGGPNDPLWRAVLVSAFHLRPRGSWCSSPASDRTPIICSPAVNEPLAGSDF